MTDQCAHGFEDFRCLQCARDAEWNAALDATDEVLLERTGHLHLCGAVREAVRSLKREVKT